MKVLRVTAKVYDLQTREFVQRTAEVSIPDEVANALVDAIHNQPNSHIRAYGFGTANTGYVESPIGDPRHFGLDPQLSIVDVAEDKVIGGWRNM